MNNAVHSIGRPDDVASPAPLRLAIVDDHIILRQGLRALLEIESDLAIVGEAGTATEAIELARRAQPAIVISDIALPDRSGLGLMRELRACCPGVRILILTAYSTEDYIRAALNAHTDGYVLKESSRAELLYAIRAVAKGETYICTTITNRLMSGYLRGNGATRPGTPMTDITDREREVLTRIATGLPNKAIAKELDVAVKTVEKHRSNLMRKLSLHNMAEVTMYAVRTGLISAGSTALDQHPS